MRGFNLLETASVTITNQNAESALDPLSGYRTLRLGQKVANQQITLAFFELAMSYKQGKKEI